MFNNIVLDVFVGLIFIYLLYSLLGTVLQEILARMLSMRSRNLLKAITVMLEDREETKKNNIVWCKMVKYIKYIFTPLIEFYVPFGKDNFAKAFYCHPSIKYLGENESKSKPSYIKPENFSQTIIQLLRGDTYDGTTPQMNLIYNTLFTNKSFVTHTKQNVIIDKETLLHLQQLYVDAHKDIDRFKALLDSWYNETMDRASGWYKKKVQTILLIIGLFMAISFNVDTIAIYNLLAKDKTARENMVQLAISSIPKYDSIVKSIKQQSKETTYNITFKDSAALKDTVIKVQQTYLLTSSDSVLAATQKTVQSDIDKASSIAALGWPDRDSCKKYDSLKKAYVFACSCGTKNNDTSKLNSEINYYNTAYRCSGNPYQNNKTRWIGWLLTALAISLGAPFWFDMLSKIIQLRGTGPRPAATDSNIGTNTNNNTNNGSGSSPVNRVG